MILINRILRVIASSQHRLVKKYYPLKYNISRFSGGQLSSVQSTVGLTGVSWDNL